MAKVRDLVAVERDLRRMKRAERRLRRDWNAVHRKIAREGGLMPAAEAHDGKARVRETLRQQRELNKALKIATDEIRSLLAEKAALELQVKELNDEYSLA